MKKYPTKVIDEGIMPLSKFGQNLKNLGVDVAGFNFTFRQTIAKIMQVLIIMGFAYLAFRKKYVINNKLDMELVTFAVGCLLFILLLLILPVISTEYGLLRAFQQALMVLSLFIVIGSLLLMPGMREKIKIVFATFLAVTFFLSTTGFITQLLGGYHKQMHLNNGGRYYDLYYLHRSEILAARWLSNYPPKAHNKESRIIQIDPFTLNKITPYASLNGLIIIGHIYPALIEKKSHVFLGPQALKGQSSFNYRGDDVNYTFPLEFFDNEKDLIYSAGDVRVYK